MLFSLGTNFSPVALAVLTLESWQSLESLLLLLWKLDVTVCHFQPLPHPPKERATAAVEVLVRKAVKSNSRTEIY